MRLGRPRRLVQVELAIAIGGGLLILLPFVAQPTFTLTPEETYPIADLVLAFATGLYLIGLAWMLEIATEEA